MLIVKGAVNSYENDPCSPKD